VIYLTDSINATDTDILANTRLSSIPYIGNITIQASASTNTATNNFRITIQLPDGKVPVDNQLVTANAAAVQGILDTRTLDQWTFPALFGGHFTISLTETGASSCTWRVVLRP